jgi:MFS family permease
LAIILVPIQRTARSADRLLHCAPTLINNKQRFFSTPLNESEHPKMSSSETVLAGAPASAIQRNQELAAVYRKVAFRLIPLLLILFLMGWIDRVNVGFTKLQMNADLNFSETIYGLGAGIFFIGYVIFEVPSNLVLMRFGAKKTLSRIAIAWGLACLAMMFVTTPSGFYTIRFIMGAAEAGLWPGIVLYLTYWLPTTRSSKAFAIIGCASSVSGIIGGPFAGLIMENLGGANGWHGWQWVFLIEGIPSVLLGILTIWVLSDKPQDARWLTSDEKRLLTDDLTRNGAALGSREHSIGHAFKNPQVWTFLFIYFCIIFGQSALVFWAPSIVKELGFTNTSTVGYIISGAFIVGVIAVVLNGIHSDRTQEARFHTGLAVLVGGLGCAALGILVMLDSQWAILALYVALPGILCSVPVFWQLPNKVLTGGAAAAGLALINSIGNMGGFFAPFLMGAVKDATGQVTIALWIAAAMLVIGAIVTMRQRRV